MTFLTRTSVTRIGIAGALTSMRPLFNIAAEDAAKETGSRVKLVWLSGKNNEQVDARILVSKAVPRGKSDVEISLELNGNTAKQLPAIRAAIILAIQKVS